MRESIKPLSDNTFHPIRLSLNLSALLETDAAFHGECG
jgi:hypothetical protein